MLPLGFVGGSVTPAESPWTKTLLGKSTEGQTLWQIRDPEETAGGADHFQC
jgi:hypothetical protein